MNNISIAGRIGKDAECRKTQTGKTITSFSVAVSERDNTTWFDCASGHHEKLEPYLKKGTPVAVTGRMSFKKVEDGKGYWHTLWINDITLLGSRSSIGQEQGASTAEVAGSSPAASASPFDDTDEAPW